jgi:hypothetical protein
MIDRLCLSGLLACSLLLPGCATPPKAASVTEASRDRKTDARLRAALDDAMAKLQLDAQKQAELNESLGTFFAAEAAAQRQAQKEALPILVRLVTYQPGFTKYSEYLNDKRAGAWKSNSHVRTRWTGDNSENCEKMITETVLLFSAPVCDLQFSSSGHEDAEPVLNTLQFR